MDAITDTAAMGVADAAYCRLRSDILGGELLPGMKLKLDALRDRYEVSVNTLRETLSRLAADGLVEAEGQRGFTVIPTSPRRAGCSNATPRGSRSNAPIWNGNRDWLRPITSSPRRRSLSQKRAASTPTSLRSTIANSTSR
jgi:DNA-binding transcriptional MocR family regulator